MANGRWRFAVDEQEGLIVAPFPFSTLSGDTSLNSGSFLLFDVRRGDCCRTIPARPADAAAGAAGDLRPFEMFGCCCLLPRVGGGFASASLLQQEVLIHPLQQEELAPVLHASFSRQQGRACGRQRCDPSLITTSRQQESKHRFDSTCSWECFCGATGVGGAEQRQQQQQISSACCALLRCGGWPPAAPAAEGSINNEVAAAIAGAAAAAADEVGGSAFVGASSWGLHLLVTAPPESA